MSKNQGAKIAKSLENKNEDTRLLFSLADFFKAQDAAKCYDLAERLFRKWKSTRDGEVRDKACRNAKINAKTMDKTATNNKKPNQARASSMKKVSSDNSSSKKSQTQPNKSEAKNEVFKKLYATAEVLREKTKTRREIQNELVMRNCTFRPKLHTANSAHYKKSLGDPYERLSSTNHNQYIELLQDKKAALELQHCTFSPDLPNLEKYEMQSPPKGDIYKRVCDQRKIVEESRKLQKAMLNAKEMDECTFSPIINQEKKEPAIKETAYNRLYNDYEKKRHAAEKKQLEHSEAQLAGCTFKPDTNSTTPKLHDSADELPRHERLFLRGAERTRAKEQRAAEAEREAREMHESVERRSERKPSSQQLCAKSDQLYKEYKETERKRQALQQKHFKVI